jgi:hypothetical protein
MKRSLAVIGLVVLFGLPAFGQSMEYMDRVLSSPKITTADAAYLVLVSADVLQEDTESAFSVAKENKWLNASAKAEAPVSLSAFSYLVMRAFKLKGGLMYSLFPGPRYAYRELSYSGAIQGRHDPADPVSGDLAIRMVSAFAKETEAAE